jgi:acyl-phosphate glycerol 3-phosphate acyltransferase
MTDVPFLALVAIAAYLVGAVPFGYVVARAKGVDILSHGSGNIGATNVGRILGRRYGILVFLLDFAKGALPTAVAGALAPGGLPSEWPQVTAGVAAFLGHLFPVYLRFRGGKGVATGAGVVAVLAPGPTAGAALAWLTVVAALRYVSLASLVAAALLCVLRFAFTPDPLAGPRSVVTAFCVIAVVLVAVRHRANIGRLLHGNENRLKEGPVMLQLAKTLHVLAVGLWFGSAVFFTAMGLVVFGAFEQIAEKPAAERPTWLPLPALYDQAPPSPRFPDPLRKEQGIRVAGAVVGPLFPIYFALQTVCGVVALVTAFGWIGMPGSAGKLRAILLAVALGCVAGGWALERKVSDLRVPRDEKTDQVLRNATPPDAKQSQIAEAEAARRVFVQWHLASVLLNLVTVGFVTAGMGLVAWLPTGAIPSDRRLEAGAATPNGTMASAETSTAAGS